MQFKGKNLLLEHNELSLIQKIFGNLRMKIYGRCEKGCRVSAL